MSRSASPGPGRQEIRTAATRARLIGAARELFADRGFDAVPAEELDAPVVLGWERWLAVDAAHGLGLLKQGLGEAMAAGDLPAQPVDPLAHLLSGAMNEAGMWIARAPDPEVARREAGEALVGMLASMRTRAPG
jgi:AcrR family transcriptional regulator